VQWLPASVFGQALSGSLFFYTGVVLRYNKAPKSYGELADILISRGLHADKLSLVEVLERISYYRLSGYWYPFRKKDSDLFLEGTNLDEILMRYEFDRELRRMVFSNLDSVEIAIRNRIMHTHVMAYTATGYKNHRTFKSMHYSQHASMMSKFYNEYLRSKSKFVSHFKVKYGLFDDFPLWMACELTSFGSTVKLFQGMSRQQKLKVSNNFSISEILLESWLVCLIDLRNLCAHHNRLWNRRFGKSPKRPGSQSKYPDWYTPVQVFQTDGNARLFPIITVLKFLSGKIGCNEGFAEDMHTLIRKYPGIPIEQMGFPDNWQKCPVWSR